MNAKNEIIKILIEKVRDLEFKNKELVDHITFLEKEASMHREIFLEYDQEIEELKNKL